MNPDPPMNPEDDTRKMTFEPNARTEGEALAWGMGFNYATDANGVIYHGDAGDVVVPKYEDRYEDVLAIYDNEEAAQEHLKRDEAKCEKRQEQEGPSYCRSEVTNLYWQGDLIRFYVCDMEVRSTVEESK